MYGEADGLSTQGEGNSAVSLAFDRCANDADMRIDVLDLEFQGTPHVIASFLVHGPDGPVLVETGPASTLETLLSHLSRRGIEPGDVRDVLVTHVHLDHAGCAGWWARKGARVWVHEVGAPHIVDPATLLRSATRIYGDRMDTLWGEVLPAPAPNVIAVADGDTIDAGGLRFTAVATPGHAWHHHVFTIDGVAFAGDAAGIQLPDNRWIDLPAPPPEFDLGAWQTSLRRLRGLGLKTLYRTHFGASSNVAAELTQFEDVLIRAAESIRAMQRAGTDRDAMIEPFSELMRDWAIELDTSEADTRAYELANPRVMSVDGIARYWRKRS